MNISFHNCKIWTTTYHDVVALYYVQWCIEKNILEICLEWCIEKKYWLVVVIVNIFFQCTTPDNWPIFHIKFFSWAWNHLIWHTDCSKNPLGVLSRAWKFFWYISMFQVIKISYWTIEKWIWKITYFSSMAYTKKIRKKVSPQKIPTGSLSLVHKSYMVTEASLPFISPIIKIRLQKWTVR